MAIQVDLFEKPSEQDVRRTENIQIAVTVAIISQYIASSFGTSIDFVGEFGTFNEVAAIALIYLCGKSLTITVRPVYDSRILKIFDFYILPFLFLLSLLSIVFIIALAQLNISIPDRITITEITALICGILSSLAVCLMRRIGCKLKRQSLFSVLIVISGLVSSTVGVYLSEGIMPALALLVSLALSTAYADQTQKTMSAIESTVPNVERLIFPSSGSGKRIPLTLTNRTGQTIPREGVRINIDTSDGVDVEIPEAIKREEHSWMLSRDLMEAQQQQIEICFTRSESATTISDEYAEISISLNGEVQNKSIINLKG